MKAGISVVSALSEPAAAPSTAAAAAPQLQPHASHHSLWSVATSSVRSFWPTPYVTDQRTGRRVSLLRKLYEDQEQRSRRQRLALSFLCLLLYLGMWADLGWRSEGSFRGTHVQQVTDRNETGVAVWAYGFGFERFGVIKAMYFAVVTLTSYVKGGCLLVP